MRSAPATCSASPSLMTIMPYFSTNQTNKILHHSLKATAGTYISRHHLQLMLENLRGSGGEEPSVRACIMQWQGTGEGSISIQNETSTWGQASKQASRLAKYKMDWRAVKATVKCSVKPNDQLGFLIQKRKCSTLKDLETQSIYKKNALWVVCHAKWFTFD